MGRCRLTHSGPAGSVARPAAASESWLPSPDSDLEGQEEGSREGRIKSRMVREANKCPCNRLSQLVRELLIKTKEDFPTVPIHMTHQCTLGILTYRLASDSWALMHSDVIIMPGKCQINSHKPTAHRLLNTAMVWCFLFPPSTQRLQWIIVF